MQSNKSADLNRWVSANNCALLIMLASLSDQPGQEITEDIQQGW
jgi:hypothetical protein